MAIKFVSTEPEPARKPAAAAPTAPTPREQPNGPAGELPLGQVSKPEKPKRKPK